MQPQSPRLRSSEPPVRARSYTSTTPLVPPRPPARTSSSHTNPKALSRRGGAFRRLVISPRTASISLVVVGLLIVGGLGFWRSNAARPTVLGAVTQQASFGVYFPTARTILTTVDKDTISYQASDGLLSYTARLADGTTVSFNQQATPESFVDIPQAYDKLIASLLPYYSFDSVNGRVVLTSPKELQGDQSAVLNAKGTLLFARSNTKLSNDTWRQIFNDLELAQ